ncbi:aromatic ring-opening dioxygenase LigA [Agromyces sp. G08B096]|uniref:Aromatic ring-opening dioxygenase LigA n=1 Tax=Agromyces sp. G08B096 TaxID=3156399 RepID=A0AAU7W8D6_9MICO
MSQTVETSRAEGTGGIRAAGIIGIVLGIVFILVGAIAWVAVSSELRAEQITVSDDAPFFPGAEVAGPLTAYSEAEAIRQHVLSMTDGKTYAELDRDDPLRETAATGSYLRTSLFTSVVSFGIALFAIGVGVLAIVLSWGLLLAARRRSVVASPGVGSVESAPAP